MKVLISTLNFKEGASILRRAAKCCANLRENTMKHFTLAATLLGAIAIAPMANAQSFSQLIEDIEAVSYTHLTLPTILLV